MEQPTTALPPRVSRDAARRAEVGAACGSRALRLGGRLALRKSSRVMVRLIVTIAVWVAGGIALPATSDAQEAGGPIVIAGPGEHDAAALAALAERVETPKQKAAAAASLADATAQSLGRAPARDADPFARAASASGSIVIAGANDAAAAPTMIRTSFKPDANGVVTIPAAGRGNAATARESSDPRAVVPVVVTPASATGAPAQPVAANPPATDGFDSLASRGEPPQFGANGRAIAQPARAAKFASAASGANGAARLPAASAAQVAQGAQGAQAAQVAQVASQPATPPGQQDPEAIHAVALAFLKQQAAGLPGKVDITVASAFQRGIAQCGTLEPFLPTGSRMWGRTTVGVRCAGERPWTIYLQARISVHATYYLAARAMAPGEVLGAADLVARDADLTGLPQAIVTDPSQAVGAVTLVRVTAGMPLRRDMLRSASSVTIGQTVRVVAAGSGFSISSEGSAMNNASPGQQVRVKTANGQIVSGIVKDGATVEIQL